VTGERTIVFRAVEGIDTTDTRVTEPWVSTGSLGGTIQACEPQANRTLPWTCVSVPWAVPLEAVDAIKVRRSDWVKTGLLVGVVLSSLLVVYGTGDLY